MTPTTSSRTGFPIDTLPDLRLWLRELTRHSLGDIELTVELDAELSARALAARDDAVVRADLFTSLSMKISRFCSRFRRWNLLPWEFGDVIQETYPVFVTVLETWQPLAGNGGPAGFGYYFMQVFPLRLSDRVNAMVETRKRNGAPVPLPWVPEADDRPDAGTLESDIEATAVLAAICGRLNAADAVVLRLAATTELDYGQIASIAGISRSTLYRHWNRIVSIAREELAG